MLERMREDIQSVFHHDPAARNALEVLTCYPDLHAAWLHRLAHDLWTSGWEWLAHLMSNLGRWMTSIEIHPGTRIGRRLFINHGMDTVIGGTAKTGGDVTLYQGVTLGGTTWNEGKCHPIFGNNVVVGVGAKVLDPFTINEGAKVSPNAMVTKEVPPGATIVGIPGRIIMYEDTEQQARRQTMAGKLGFDACGIGQDMPNPVARAIGQLLDHLQAVDDRPEDICQALTTPGGDYCAKDLPILCEEDFAGVKGEGGNPAA